MKKCYNSKVKIINRQIFESFYKSNSKVKDNLRVKIITSSLESLINKELIVGHGIRTPHKWFIRQVSLTRKGEKVVKKLIGEQLLLPLKKRNV